MQEFSGCRCIHRPQPGGHASASQIKDSEKSKKEAEMGHRETEEKSHTISEKCRGCRYEEHRNGDQPTMRRAKKGNSGECTKSK